MIKVTINILSILDLKCNVAFKIGFIIIIAMLIINKISIIYEI